MGTQIDASAAVSEYVARADWRVRANANQGYSLGGLVLNVAGKTIANYWLDEVFSPGLAAAHRDGDLHVHDLDVLGGYCAGWSLRQLLSEGFGGVPGAVSSRPPRHLGSALGQIVNFFGTLQNEWAGAQAFSSFDTLLAPYVHVDRLSQDEVTQALQEFVHNLNVPSRWGTQTPFTNLTFDLTCPEDLAEEHPVVGEDVLEVTYGDLQKESDMINRAFVAVVSAGDAAGRVFTFPIPTYNITPDFDWDSEISEEIFTMTARYGTPYFQNFVSSDLNPGDVRSMCCRLQLDLRELLARGNGLFGSGEQTGSIGVVTVNCARLGHVHGPDRDALYAALDRLIDLAADGLEARRATVQELMDAGLYPWTQRYLGTLDAHFSTIGVNGVNEMIRNATGDTHDITTPTGHAMALELLDHVRGRLVEIQERTGHLYNLEATPAEGTTYRFAREDRSRYPGILQAGSDEQPYYTNSTQLPVGFTDDPFEALARQDELQRRYTGGTVLHLYLGEQVSSAESCRRLVRRALENHRLPYLTVTPTFSICATHGYLAGDVRECPTCSAPTEVWTRVMGYFRPVASFNTGKQGEYAERVTFREPTAVGVDVA
ncbi:ribonucleoside triphosphate reductase [Isoptericola sp. AK164]|uniref:ribonucleoside triphosphate reductase n=1 Tax=Isoptericola sp. AK164 TaxID=3024246 RepID=UPI00241851B6|nr:ribonucleoside triphosphate reductase [Isoptericola sp. AK164]